MKKITLILFVLSTWSLHCCSVYKITMNGKTFMGNNEDYWNPHTRIWFEKGKNGSYGCSYVGFAHLYPEGGINEKGLAFDGFAVPYREIKKNPYKLTYDTTTLRKVMQNCQSADEVYTFLSKYDLSPLYAGMLLFVDRSGKYLVVEGDTMIKGNDDKYLLSNFCPSKTKDVNDVKIPMYQSGRKLMAGHVDTSLTFLKTLSDTLHQSWPGNIGGTLYTTIYDLNDLTIHLYFYHDYTKSVTFKLADELIKEDRVVVNIPKLFPNNVEGGASVWPHITEMISAIDRIVLSILDKQEPLVMQPIWKTNGKSPKVADNSLDVFVWSNFAFTQLFVDVARGELSEGANKITRQVRTIVWLFKMLYDFAKQGQINHHKIIDELSYNTKNDKAFAVSGRVTHHYMTCSELTKPRIQKKEIKKIILGGGQNLLSPERRFDAIIYNSPELFT